MSKGNTLGSFQSSNKEIQEFGSVKIENNAIYFKDSALQISNVSRTRIGIFAKDPFPIWVVFVAIIAIGLMLTKSFVFIVIGLGLGALCWYVIREYKANNADKFGLQIEMNSGFLAMFVSTDKQFLAEFQNAITNDFVERSGGKIINLDNKTIIDNKGIISHGDNSANTINRSDEK